MSEVTDLEQHKYELASKAWSLQGRIWLKRGLNLNELFLQWAQRQKETFQNPGSRVDFDELCDHGCVSQILAGLLILTRRSPKLAPFWTTIVGDPKARRKTIQTLESAANTLERA